MQGRFGLTCATLLGCKVSETIVPRLPSRKADFSALRSERFEAGAHDTLRVSPCTRSQNVSVQTLSLTEAKSDFDGGAQIASLPACFDRNRNPSFRSRRCSTRR
jgi:hypothetical protein